MTRIAFISDIHANMEALNAVLQEIDKHGADMIICLGDVVGYGPNPKECIDIIRSREIPTIKGNHDDYCSMLFEADITKRLRDDIKTSIEWTQTQLSFDDVDWLAKLPESLASDEDFNLIHGSNTPNHYNYCRDEETIKLNFEYQQYPLSFCGHSHSPLIGLDRGAELPYVDYIRKQTIKPDAKVLVNVGSVGQPRDGDPRATVVYYEYEERALSISRIPYNIKITQEKIRAANLPEKFAARLAVGK